MRAGGQLDERVKKLFCRKVEHANIIIRGDDADEQGELSGGRYAEFWRLICDSVANEERGNIFQVPIEVMPVMIQISTSSGGTGVAVEKVQRYLRDNFRFDDLSDNSADCIVTTGEETTTLWFPYCRVQAADFLDADIPELEKILRCPIDTDSYASGVPVYGSGQEVFTHLYLDRTEYPEEEAEDDNDPVQMLDPEAHSKIDQDVINRDILFRDIPVEKTTGQFWIPMILAVDYWKSVTCRRVGDEPVVVAGTGRTYDLKLINSQICELYTDSNNTLEKYMMFIGMWKTDSILSPKYWKLIGAAFCTLCDGSERGIVGWVKIIKAALKNTKKKCWLRSTTNLHRQCSLAYDGFKPGKHDSKSLAQIARKDSPREYRAWHDEWVYEAAVVSMDGTEESFARVFYRMEWLEYAFTHTMDDKMMCWRFHSGRMIRDYGYISVRLAISNRLRRLYNSIRADIGMQAVRNPALSAEADQASEHVRKAIRALGSQRMKMNIVRALSERFDVPNLDSYIDSDPDITLLADGNVMVATANNIYIREGLVQDYLCKSFGSYYKPTMSWDHPDVRKVLDWYFMMWIDKDLILMMRKFIASLLRGGQHDKKFYLFIGETGSNMKTAFQRALCLMCGNKAVVMPANFLNTGRGKANDASPMEAQLDGASLMILDEFEPDMYFLPGLVKGHTGGNTATARKLFQAPKEFQQTHKTVGIGNKPPLFKKEDALVDRIVYVPFLTRMTYNPPKDPMKQIEKREFKRDILFMDSLPQLRHAMLWIAVQDYPIYCKEGMSQKAASAEAYTQKYWDSLDRFKIFADEHIGPDPGSNGVEVFRLCNRFTRWYSISYKNATPPDRADIIKEFTAKYGDPVGGTWPDIKLKEYDTGNRRM